uniref:Granulysin n=1 Tax=Gallus gallus TaxID=9031 RepID=A0A8V0Z8H1_CHICK
APGQCDRGPAWGLRTGRHPPAPLCLRGRAASRARCAPPSLPSSCCGDARGGAVQVAVTEPPRDDHRDLDAGSHWEQQWHLLQDGSAAWDADEGDAMGPGKGIKCRFCVSLVKKVQKIVGDDPDEDAINDALNKVCSTGRRQRSICKQLLKKLRQQLSDALQNNDDPRDVCTTLGLCKG